VALFLRTVVLLLAWLAVSGSTALAQATATPTATPAATATPVSCVTPAHGIVVMLENPQPGDTLLSGTQVVMNGIAYDTNATSGSGISSVTIYLGARDAGGLALGTALLGQPNPTAPAGSQFANAGFTLRTPALPSGSGGRSIFVYARSLVSNAEGVLEVPVNLNSAPTPVRGQVPTAVVPTPPACTPTPVPTATATATATATIAPAAAAVNTATPTPRATATAVLVTPPPTVPVAEAPTVPPPAAASAGAAANAVAAPTTAQTTAPRGGGMPASVGLLVLALGAAIVGGGMAMRRRR
jgi:hypothetical protein